MLHCYFDLLCLQGDCSLQMGDVALAIKHYEASVQFLESCDSGDSFEVAPSSTNTRQTIGTMNGLKCLLGSA